MLTVSFATGTEPGKWFRRYEEFSGTPLHTFASDDPLAESADLFLVRLPDGRVGDEHHVVRLYEEAPGVAVPKDSVFAEVGEPVAAEDVAGEIVNFAWPQGGDPAAVTSELRMALQVVAANVGVAFAPLPLLKALSKKQVVPLPLEGNGSDTGAGSGTSSVALVWLKERDSDEIQDFVGVAKGRTARSSRQSSGGDNRGAHAQKSRKTQTRKTRNRNGRKHTR